MNEEHKVRESLSALVDDELSELELQRLLKQSVSEDALAAMQRYQAVHAVLAGQGTLARLDIRARVASALEAEPGLTPPAQQDSREISAVKLRRHLFGGVAVAASVAFAVIFSAQLMREQPSTASPTAMVQMASGPAASRVAPALVSAPRDTALVASDVSTLRSIPLDRRAPLNAKPVTEQTMSDEHLHRLNSYLMRHAEHAALSNGQTTVPFARLVGHEAMPAPQR